MKKWLNRLLAAFLSVLICVEALPLQVLAEGEIARTDVYLPEIELEDEILTNDVFYFASTSASVDEYGHNCYLLRLGRGGDAAEAASVQVKIADVTASYGTDYTVALRGDDVEVINPDDNVSLMEEMEDQPFTQTEMGDDEELEEIIEDDTEGQETLNEGVSETLTLLQDESGLTQKYDGQSADGVELDAVQLARAEFTGVDATSQVLTAESSSFEDLQSVANVLTNAVVGATLDVDFAAGESEKYLEILPENNGTGDGDRMFYLVLSNTTGSTTNSAASSCAVTIVDDEEQEPSVVSFAEAEYHPEADADTVTVTVTRTGAINTVVSAVVTTTEEGSAMMGRDYSEVDYTLLFPFGVSELTVDVPIRTEYFSGDKDFTLALTAETGCSVDVGTTTVYLTGTYDPESTAIEESSDDVSLAEDTDSGASAETTAESAYTSNNLATIRTLDTVNISSPAASGHQNNYYGGKNRYDGDNWILEWDDNTCWRRRTGVVGAIWKLSGDTNNYWIGGAQVTWGRTGSCARIRVKLIGDDNMSSSSIGYTDWGKWDDRGDTWLVDDVYNSQSGFTWGQTVTMYPGHKNSDGSNTADKYESPAYIAIYNEGECDDCNCLRIYNITPVLRPFQFRLKDAAKLSYLQADGTYAVDNGDSVRATISNSGSSTVCFLGDGFTVAQNAGSNVQQYATITGLNLVSDSGNTLYTFGTNSSAANDSISWTLSKENITAMVNSMGVTEFRNSLKENTAAENNKIYYGVADYANLTVQPTFGYVNAKVTLYNDKDFPVTMTISGTAYTLAAGERRELTFHKGDILALSSITLSGDAADNYTVQGVHTEYKYSEADSKTLSGTSEFSDGAAIYLGSSSSDHRLSCAELTVTPLLGDKSNQIVIRVKTSELSQFTTVSYDQDTGKETENSLFYGNGTVNGEYTEFVYAKAGSTVAGKLYPITATPKDPSATVCVWYDKTTGRSYEGNTLYFKAGTTPANNIITLSAGSAKSSISLTGTLHYMDYNLHTLNAGSVTALPASGALVAAGSVSAIADDDGVFRTNAETSPFYISGTSGHYLRYLVSVNGNTVTAEAALPTEGGTVDLSNNFPNGVSPVMSEIFDSNHLALSAAYPSGSTNKVVDNAYLPIDDKDSVTMTLSIKPVTYTVQSTGENGMTETTKKESPLSARFVVYDANGNYKGAYGAVEGTADAFGSVYTFTSSVDFSSETSDGSFVVENGDRLYLRLTTDRLATGDSSDSVYKYTYSDVFTGYTFTAPSEYAAPVVQGIASPVNISYDSLPLLGTSGMALDFPFVTVGFKKIDRGYRMYIGVSAAQIYDKVKDTNLTSYASDAYASSLKDGWKDTSTSLKDKLSQSMSAVFGGTASEDGIGETNGVSTSSLGNPSWKFDMQFGAYFDFYTPTVTTINASTTSFYFAGVGVYAAASLGFKKAWYFVVPVVFIPVYIGIEINGSVMGFMGAQATGAATISLDDAKHETVDFDSSLSEFTGSVTGAASVQICGGVGLCDFLGVRGVGTVSLLANYEPSDLVSDTGGYIDITAGIIIDLFLFSVPLTFTLADWTFGSFADYEDGVSESNVTTASDEADYNTDPFTLRSGSDEDSDWVGNSPQAGLTVSSESVLVDNAYEHPDAQVLTMEDGTIVVAYIDSDNEKGEYQRTTLKLTTFGHNGHGWSAPVAVCEDDTADFQPSIAETKDGRLLVTWVSTGSDSITDDTSTVDYLNSMDIYAAFADVRSSGVVEVETPTCLTTGTSEKYYDSMPTAVCDPVSGDAIVYYVKSGSTTASATTLANPYTNDCAVCYMYYNAEADDDNGTTIPAGWLKNNYYSTEGSALDLSQWGGQRFFSGATFTEDGSTKFYSIPDLTAIGYDGSSVIAYTVDTDSSSSTDEDKELYLQTFDFATHTPGYLIQITDNDVADTKPQFFRSGDDDVAAHDGTRLFWYQNNANVAYIDVSKLLTEGIDPETGALLTSSGDDDTYTYTDGDGEVHYRYTEPAYVATATGESAEANQMADFRVTEDSNRSIYVVWTESTTTDGTTAASEIYAMSLISSSDTYDDDEGNESNTGSSGWSKPYQITDAGKCNDELAITLYGDDLVVIHTSYTETLNIQETSDRYEGVSSTSPIEISDLELCETVLTACGSVEPTDLTVSYPAESEDEQPAPVELPEGGKDVTLTLTIANNGLTTAKGYQYSVYAVQNGQETLIETKEISDQILPNASVTHEISYTLPEDVSGLSFKAVTRELKDGTTYYEEEATYETDPLSVRADYVISELSSYQAEDGFHLCYNIRNEGNAAAASDDTLKVVFNGPFNIDLDYAEEDRVLYNAPVGDLAIGESRNCDVLVDVDPAMMKEYCYITASVEAVKTDAEGNETALSDLDSVSFTLARPMNMTLGDMTLKEGESAEPSLQMELADKFDSTDITYSVDDLTVAAIQDGKVVGLSAGTTTLTAIHEASGAVVTSTITVTSAKMPDGWNKLDGSWYYYQDNTLKTGWLLDSDSGKWYYLDPTSGAMQTGWQKVNGKWYYLNTAMKTGWQKIDGSWYYLGTGAMLTGWQKIDGKWYYLNTAMKTGWQKIDGKWYYLNNYMLTGWQTIGGKRYYLNSEMKTGWQKISGKWYYLANDLKTGWQKIGDKWYYLDPSTGAMLTGWQKISNKWYYLNSSMQTGWQKINDKWYYLGTGAMTTGWKQISGSWYYFGTNGAMVSGCTMTIDGKSYTFGTNGALVK